MSFLSASHQHDASEIFHDFTLTWLLYTVSQKKTKHPTRADNFAKY